MLMPFSTQNGLFSLYPTLPTTLKYMNRSTLHVNWVLLVLVFFNTKSMLAQTALLSDQSDYTINPILYYYKDSLGRQSVEDVAAQRNLFRPIPSSDANLGYSNKVHWLQFDLKNEAPSTKRWWLELGYSAYSEVELYVFQGGKLRSKNLAGDQYGTKSRPISFHNFVFDLPLQSQQSYTIFIKVRPFVGQILVPITLWDSHHFVAYASLYQLFWGLYFGMLVIVFLYHSFFFLFNYRQQEYRGYLFLSIYLLTYIIFELTRGGAIGARYLWPQATWWIYHGFVTSFFICMIMFVAFYGYILKIPESMPNLYRIFWALFILSLILLIIIDLDIWPISKNQVAFTLGGSVGLLLLVAAYRSWHIDGKIHSPGFYYLIAAMTLYTGGIMSMLHRTGILHGSHFFNMNALNLASIIEFVLLSIGLTLRVRTERQEKNKVIQDRGLELVKVKQQEVLRMTRHIHDLFGSQTVYLQQKVMTLLDEDLIPANSQRVRELYDIVGDILDGIKLLAHYYIPRKLEDLGLRKVLEQLVWKYDDIGGNMKFEGFFNGSELLLSTLVKEELYMVVMELFTNCLKHSQAREVVVLSYDEDNHYCLQVRDDGIGLGDQSTSNGNGLVNIQSRLDSIGATFKIVSQPDLGTVFLIMVKMDA
jgi:two-component system, sensor histidine kinase LadS